MTARWAVYWAPAEGSALARQAAAWLGRDLSGHPVPRPLAESLPPDLDLAAITAEPAFYGFHGTLKPPFALAAGRDARALVRAVDEELCAGRQPFALPAPRVAALGRFLAVVPGAACPPLDALAADAVRRLDAFRAPQSAAELEKRRARGLTPRQEDNLRSWGYPYVLDEFRFHLTLTGPLPAAEGEVVREFLASWLAPALAEPLLVDGVALYRQPDRSTPFILAERLNFH